MNNEYNPEMASTGGSPLNSPDYSTKNPPWEHREALGFGPALIETWKLSLTQPRLFFGNFNPTGNILDPLLYIIIMTFVSGLSIFLPGFDSFLPGAGSAEAFPMMATGSSKVMFFFFSPLLALVFLCILSGIYHLGLILTGAVTQPFFATFKVLAYTTGTSVFSLIPVIGSIINAIWNIVILVIGLSEVHRAELWKCIVAVLVPVFLCCCAAMAFASVMVAGLAAVSQ